MSKETTTSDQSYRIYKIRITFFHIIALAIFVAGMSLIYCNPNFKKGLSGINAESFEDSPSFNAVFDDDVTLLFDYIKYADIFETDGMFDVDKDMFSINQSPDDEVIYTVQDVIDYAKENGYYIDDNYQLVSVTIDDNSYKTTKPTDSYAINWRTYKRDVNLDEPSDAYMPLDSIINEALTALASYYKAYSKFILHDSNFHFTISYPSLYRTNTPGLDAQSAHTYGRYAIADSTSLTVDTNLSYVPTSIDKLAIENDYNEEQSYISILSVDTSYPANDDYSMASADYKKERNLFFIGFVLAIIGGISMVITYLMLAFSCGKSYPTDKDIVLKKYEHQSIEIYILLCAFTCMVLLFLSDHAIGDLLHVALPVTQWSFSDEMLDCILVYLCIFVTSFIIIKQIRASYAWEHSYCKKFIDDTKKYFISNSFSDRMTIEYFILISINIIIAFISAYLIFALRSLSSSLIMVGLVAALIIFDLILYNINHKRKEQADKLSIAIKNISYGDTAYRIDETSFTGKEASIAQDINNIREGLESALDDKVRSARLKSDLITNVSHDIRTPLTSIINYIDLIKRENPSDPKIKEYISILEAKSQHLKHLTDDLLEASKASSGNVNLDIITLDFVELVHQSNGEFEEKYKERELTIVSNIPDESILIKADGHSLWRVLENVYNNAYKYATPRSRVYVSIEKNPDTVSFTIKNVSENPLNINPDELTERFVRGDVSRSSEGSGLGLSIAQSLTELQGGTFTIDIDGDLFKATITLPLSI